MNHDAILDRALARHQAAERNEEAREEQAGDDAEQIVRGASPSELWLLIGNHDIEWVDTAVALGADPDDEEAVVIALHTGLHSGRCEELADALAECIRADLAANPRYFVRG